MQLYQVVYPFSHSISADSFNDAIKNFSKVHRDMNINHIIVTDQNRHMQARMKNFSKDGRNFMGFNYFPYQTPIGPDGKPYYGLLPLQGIPLSNTLNTYAPMYPLFNPTMSSNVKSPASPVNPATVIPTFDDKGKRFYTMASSPLVAPIAPMSPVVSGAAVIPSTVPPPVGSPPRLSVGPEWFPTIVSYD